MQEYCDCLAEIGRQFFASPQMEPSMHRKSFMAGILAAGCLAFTVALMPGAGNAQMDKVQTSMAALKAKTAKLGEPKIVGGDPVAGKDVPALYFGSTKMNNSFDVVDEVVCVLRRRGDPRQTICHRL